MVGEETTSGFKPSLAEPTIIRLVNFMSKDLVTLLPPIYSLSLESEALKEPAANAVV